jgi:hypothetical protein
MPKRKKAAPEVPPPARRLRSHDQVDPPVEAAKHPKHVPAAKKKAESEEPTMAADKNAERRMMAATIAAGVVRVDSERVNHPEKVAEVAVEIADAINEHIDSGAGDETPEDDEVK